jgi:lipopolysaccharide transport system permease protein
VPINLRELWEYRELLYFLIWRDIKLRYKQTALGFAWAIIQPVMLMVVFTLFFGTLAKIPSQGIPYPLFTYAALLPWTLFSEGLSRSTNSLITGSALVQKIYCPRLLMPISGVISPVVDFAIALVILVALMLWYHYIPTIRILMLPVFLIMALVTSTGVGLWLSATNVRYRDVQFIVPFLIQLWLLASPIAYSSSFVPERFRVFLGINPMTGVIEGFRWAILGTNPPGGLMIVSVVIIILVLISGVFYFRRMEKSFADVI